MNKKANEAYCYYKRQMPDTVCLFRLEETYVAVGDDAVRVANYIPDATLEEFDNQMASLKLPVADILDIVGILASNGVKTKMIQSRNNLGKFDFPDVKTLENEQNADY